MNDHSNAFTQTLSCDVNGNVCGSEDELLGRLPGKLLSSEVSIAGCFLVDRFLQIKLPAGLNYYTTRVLFINDYDQCWG